MKKNKGITLIALVITIIILIILAAITINAVFGENGLILRAQEAKFKTEVSSIKDLVEVKGVEIKMSQQLQQGTQSLSDYLSALNMPEYIGSSKLVIDGTGRLAYNAAGDFSKEQKEWLEDIGIYPAENGSTGGGTLNLSSARLELEQSTLDMDHIIIFRLRIDDDEEATQYIFEMLGILFGVDPDFMIDYMTEGAYSSLEELLQDPNFRDIAEANFIEYYEMDFDTMIQNCFMINMGGGTAPDNMTADFMGVSINAGEMIPLRI